MPEPHALFRTAFTKALAHRPLHTPQGVVAGERRGVLFGYPGGNHEPTQCWVYRAHGSGIELLFSFYDNFTANDLVCKSVAHGELPHAGAGATIQFNGNNCVGMERGSLSLHHHGRVTVGAAVSRAQIVTAIRERAPEANDALGGLDPTTGWPLRIGTLRDIGALIDRLAVYAYAIEQAKRSLRGETSLPPLYTATLVKVRATPAGRSTGRGQGFQSSPVVRRAVELFAMAAATAYFKKSWPRVEDVSASRSYDLHCTRGRKSLHVEVKGTTGDGSVVLLTSNEVEHARTTYPASALFVLSAIRITETGGGDVIASGGSPRVIEPWDVDEAGLAPLTYACVLPPPP